MRKDFIEVTTKTIVRRIRPELIINIGLEGMAKQLKILPKNYKNTLKLLDPH